MSEKIIHGDCIEQMKKLKENSIDAVITDAPYGLEFMGKDWDKFGGKPDPDNEYKGDGGMKRYFKGNKPIYEWNMNEYQLWTTKWATEAFRVLKPGGYLVSLGGTRTYHRLTCGIEDAGFKIKDCLMWQYQSGFPKAQDLGKMIDKREGKERDLVKRTRIDGKKTGYADSTFASSPNIKRDDVPLTPLAKHWNGWKVGGLKPAYEPIVVAQKPAKGSMLDNILKNQVGGINVDMCRIGYEELPKYMSRKNRKRNEENIYGMGKGIPQCDLELSDKGRFPSNIIRTERFEDGLDRFYCILNIPKPSKREKNKGCDKLGEKELGHNRFDKCKKCGKYIFQNQDRPSACKCDIPQREHNKVKGNTHPTVKPIALFKRLIKLFVPYEQNPEAIVLDPFLGSGTTLCACRELNVRGIGIEQSEEYIKIAKARINSYP